MSNSLNSISDYVNRRPIIFLLGCERSGTTFVMQALSKFYSVAPGHESQWVVNAWHAFSLKKPKSANEQLQFIKKVFSDRYFANQANYHGVFFEIERFLQEGYFNFPRFVEEVFQHIAQSNGALWILNKTCLFCEHMPIVNNVFPDFRFIHLLRDGRDVGLSLQRVKGWGPKGIYGAAIWWKNRVRKIQEYMSAIPAERYLEIKYEDLLADPNTNFSKITKFYGIYDPETHKALIESIQVKQQNHGKWRNIYSRRDVDLFESIAGNILKNNGYPLCSSSRMEPLSSYREAYLKIQEIMNSHLAFYPILFKIQGSFLGFLGKFPKLQKIFFKTSFFRKYFHWNRLMKEVFKEVL